MKRCVDIIDSVLSEQHYLHLKSNRLLLYQKDAFHMRANNAAKTLVFTPSKGSVQFMHKQWRRHFAPLPTCDLRILRVRFISVIHRSSTHRPRKEARKMHPSARMQADRLASVATRKSSDLAAVPCQICLQLGACQCE